MKTIREKELKWQPKLLRNFIKFEAASLGYYASNTGNFDDIAILNHADRGNLREKIGKAHGDYRNPLEEAYAWHFDELVDLKCMYEAI